MSTENLLMVTVMRTTITLISGDILLMDATSNLDRSDTKMFHLMCPSAVGALPLTTMITSREDENTILHGLKMMKTMLPQDAFYGRGPQLGPVLGLTDDASVERNALRKVWPLMELLLCHFHVLQAHWQWLFKSSNHIEKHDKGKLLQMMRTLLYSQTAEDFDFALSEMLESSTYQKYPNYQEYMTQKILPRSQEWSTLHRIQGQLPTNNVNCSNYAESSFRITKDLKFGRRRAYNLVELLEIECDLSEYDRQRCIDLASNRLTSRLVNQRSRFLGPGSAVARKKVTIDPELIKLEGDGSFTVPSETKADVSYSVDMELRICSCPHGRLKGPCKHRMLVSLTQNLPSFDLIPESSAEMRQMWMFLGTGEHTNIDYFLPLSDPADAVGNEKEKESRIEVENINTEAPQEFDMDIENEESLMDDDHQPLSTDQQEKITGNLAMLESVLEKLKELYTNRIREDPDGYERALKTFEKHLDRIPKTNDAILQKAAHTFAQSALAPLSIQKRKKGSIIPVQVFHLFTVYLVSHEKYVFHKIL